MATDYQNKKRRLAEFHRQVKLLLTDSEQDYLYTVLKEYQAHRQVETLIQCLGSVLDTPAKLDLLKDVRNFIPSAQLTTYDNLAPYQQMAHPFIAAPRGYNTLTLKRAGRQKVTAVTASPPQPGHRHIVVSGIAEPPGCHDRMTLRTITLVKDVYEGLGFSIRGGSEHGLGIFVSEIDPNSAAERSGLNPGDNILEVNSVSFESIASSSAVKVLTGSARLKIVISRVGKIPGFKFAREKTSWYDTSVNRVVEGTYEDHGMFHHPLGLSYVEGEIERRIHLNISSSNQFLGFNIRGGSEYGLGIFVSRVDPNGVAEQKGLKVGDQVLEVNSQSFQNITHPGAVEILRSSKQLIMTVKEMGRYPAYKEIYAEYSWIDSNTGETSKSRTGYIESVPVEDPREARRIEAFTQYPRESRVDTYAQTDEEQPSTSQSDTESGVVMSNGMSEMSAEHDSTDAGIQTDEALDQSEMLLPVYQDVMFGPRPAEEQEVSKKMPKKKSAPRSMIGILALQAEHNPETRANLAAVQSLRIKGEMNVRAAYQDDKDKSRTFREKLFGTKSRADKVKETDSQGISINKKKSRKPLSAINFSLRKSRENINKPNRKLDESVFIGSGSSSKMSDLETISEHAQKLLNDDETTAVIRHVTQYQKVGDVETLVLPLLAIMDSQEKRSILTHIRNVVFPNHLEKFDKMLSEHEHWHRSRATENIDLVSAPQQAMFEPRHMTGNMEVVPRLRRRPQPQDELVVPASPTAQYKYEIHRPKSNSKVYKAKVMDNMNQTVKENESLSLSNINVNKQGSIDRISTKSDSDYGTRDVYSTTSKSKEKSAPNYGKSVDYQSSTSDYSSGMTSELSEVSESQNCTEGMSVTEEFEMSPIYETVAGATDKCNNVTLKKHQLLKQTLPDNIYTESKTKQFNEVDQLETKAVVETGEDKSHLDGQSVNLSALDFLDDLDDAADFLTSHQSETLSAPSARSEASSSRASSPPFGSYDINGSFNTSQPSPEDSLMDSTLDTNRASPRQSPMMVRRYASGPVFIPPPPPSIPPPSEDGEQEEEEEEGWEQWIQEDVTLEIHPSPQRRALIGGYHSSPRDISHHRNSPQSYSNSHGARDVDSDTLYDVSSLSKDLSSRVNDQPNGNHDNDTDSVAEIDPENKSWEFSDYDRPDNLLNVNDNNANVHSVGDSRLVGYESQWKSNDNIPDEDSRLKGYESQWKSNDNIPDEDSRLVGYESQWKSFVIEDTDEQAEEEDKDEEEDGILTVILSKNKSSLGLSISGGSNSRTQPQIKIDQVFPGGAAAEEGTLQPGMPLLMADGYNLTDCSHAQAVHIIRRAYTNKQEPDLELVVMHPHYAT